MSTETAVIPDLPTMLVDQAFSFPQKGPVVASGTSLTLVYQSASR